MVTPMERSSPDFPRLSTCFLIQIHFLPEFPGLFQGLRLEVASGVDRLISLLLVNAAAAMRAFGPSDFRSFAPSLRLFRSSIFIPETSCQIVTVAGETAFVRNGAAGGGSGVSALAKASLFRTAPRRAAIGDYGRAGSRAFDVARHGFGAATARSISRTMALVIQVYCYLIGIVSWHQYENHEKRVQLIPGRRWKLWPWRRSPGV